MEPVRSATAGSSAALLSSKTPGARFGEQESPYEQAQAPALSDIGRDSRPQDASLPVEPRAKLARLTVARVEAQIAIAAQQAAKIAVKHEGWYRVAQAELAAIRFNTKLDPRYLQLHVDGRQLPTIVRGEEDGSFDETDVVEFYGIGLDTPSTDARVYWLTVGKDLGLRMKPTPGGRGYESSTSFPFTVERKDRSIYFAALKNGEQENFFGSV